MNNLKSDTDNFKKFIGAVFLHVLLVVSQTTLGYNAPIIRYVLTIYSAYLLIFKISSYRNIFQFRVDNFQAWLIIVILLLLIKAVVQGLPDTVDPATNYLNLKQFVGEKILLYSFPLLLLVKINSGYWRYTVFFSIALLYTTVPFLLIDLPLYLTRSKSPESIIRATAGASGFLLLISPYFKLAKKRFIFIVFTFSLVLMLYHARRNMVLYFGAYLVFYLYVVLFYKSRLLNLELWKILLNLISIAIIGIFLFNLINPDFSLFFERAETGMESRENVIDDFLADITPFSGDFNFGRGMYATFFSKTLGRDETTITGLGSGDRDIIENGYLQLILNFGFLFLISFMIFSLLAFYKGFFKSKNLFSKACAAVVFINLIDMIGFGIPEITFRYLIIWIAGTFCWSHYFRNMDDMAIQKIIFH